MTGEHQTERHRPDEHHQEQQRCRLDPFRNLRLGGKRENRLRNAAISQPDGARNQNDEDRVAHEKERIARPPRRRARQPQEILDRRKQHESRNDRVHNQMSARSRRDESIRKYVLCLFLVSPHLSWYSTRRSCRRVVQRYSPAQRVIAEGYRRRRGLLPQHVARVPLVLRSVLRIPGDGVFSTSPDEPTDCAKSEGDRTESSP